MIHTLSSTELFTLSQEWLLPKSLVNAWQEVVQRVQGGTCQIFQSERNLLIVSVRAELGIDTLFIEFVLGQSIKQDLMLLKQLAQRADFKRVACYPVSVAHARLYRCLGFIANGDYYYWEIHHGR